MAKVKSKKKTPAQKLGLERMKLSVSSCRQRASQLRLDVAKEKYKGETKALALRWASWYTAKANQLAKARKAGKKARSTSSTGETPRPTRPSLALPEKEQKRIPEKHLP